VASTLPVGLGKNTTTDNPETKTAFNGKVFGLENNLRATI
jgi:hypothetical protein